MGALCGLALAVLATRAWEVFYSSAPSAALRVIPSLIAFGLLGGWIAALLSLSKREEAERATRRKREVAKTARRDASEDTD